MAMILPKLGPGCVAALLVALGLAGCVDSAAPLLGGAQPTFGPTVRIHGYSLTEGHASGPEVGNFRWDGTQYRVVGRPTFDVGQANLQLDFPADQQERRQLPNGTEYFGASGTITNVGGEAQSVPPILIVLRDARDRIVFSWEVRPPKRSLAPGESVTVNEAVTDVPRSAKFAEIGWKPA